jgi:hypothetical protein
MMILARFCICLLAVTLGWGSMGAELGGVSDGPAMREPRIAADVFRDLLGMNAAERAAALANRPETQRVYLIKKVEEYEAMAPAERQARLTQLEFSSHLMALMNTPASDRAKRLKIVPVRMRPLIEQRLEHWDRLNPEVQQKALNHEISANYLLQGVPPFSVGPESINYPPTPPAQSASSLQKLQSLSSDQRRKLAENVNQFFAMPPGARQSTLDVLSAEERQEMEKTLKAFEKLSPQQRQVCIVAFEKLSGMSKEEQAKFFHNAERWRAMPQRQREVWRTLVSIIPPVQAQPPPLPGAAGAPVRKLEQVSTQDAPLLHNYPQP